MPDLDIDLGREIAKLKSRRDELDAQEADPPGPSADDKTQQRLRIAKWKPQISEKIAALNTIKTNQAAAVVTVKCLTAAEIASAQAAMAALNIAVQRGQTWTEVVTTMTTIVTAADTVVGTAKRA